MPIRPLCAGALAAALSAALWIAAAPARAAGEPAQLLEQATQRIDGFIDRFRRTGDFTSGVADLARAQADLEEARRQFESRSDWASAALCLIKLGQSQRMQGHWDPAIGYYEAAEADARKAGHRPHQAKALMDRAKAEVQKKDLSAAATHAEQAARIAEELGDKPLLFDALDIRAQVFIAQGNTAAAADSLDRAFALQAAVKDDSLYYGHLDRADIYYRIGLQCDYKRTYQVCLDAIERARADYEQARDTAQKLGWMGLAGMTQGFLDELQLRRALIESSRQREDAAARSGMFSPQKPSDVLVTENFVTMGAADIPPAVTAMYEDMKAFRRKAGGFGSSLGAAESYVEGSYQHLHGDQDAALRSYLKAVDLLDLDRRGVHDEQARGTFMEDKIGYYYAPILQLLQRRRYDEAFELMERARGREMAELLASRELEVSRPGERALYAETVRLRSAIAKKQSEQFGLINRGADRARLAETEAQIDQLDHSYRQLQARIAQQAPHLLELTASRQAVSLQALQAAMRRDGFEVLEYLALDVNVIVWHISADSVHVRVIFLPLSELQKKVNALQDSLADPGQPFDERTARELYLYLIQPASAWLKSRRLVVVPHDCLHRLPFQVLTDPASGRSLGESFQLSYAPSATVLLALSPASSPAAGRLYAVSDPDFSTEGEAQAVAALYGDRARVVSALPTKSGLVSAVGGFDVIHLSVHGQFDPAQPLLSYLRLAPGDGDDGKLTAAEMFGLPLARSPLLVLSACESGRAATSRGDEVVGIVRGLLYAGAGTLVLSYWKVDSAATAIWMETFHRVVREQAPAEAARQALLAVKSRPSYRHPNYWGAFMLISR